MKNISSYTMIAAISLFFTAGASAIGISDESYNAQKDRIAATYEADQKNCDTLSGNPKDVCIASAKGKENVAKAKLEAERNPTAKTQYEAAVAQAEADYAVAKEQCKTSAGNTQDACEKAAKAGLDAAKSNAKVRMGSVNE